MYCLEINIGMMNYLIKDIRIVNENRTFSGDVYIKNGRIEKIGHRLQVKENASRN